MTVNVFPGVPPEEQETLTWLGMALSFIQHAERALGSALTTAFHDSR
jgi:hypothetical protein